MNTNRTTSTPVLIVGAGPTGLTLACELRRRGVNCRIIDRAFHVPATVRANGMSPRTQELFDTMGLAGALLRRGLSIRGTTIVRGSDAILSIPYKVDPSSHPDRPYHRGFVISQTDVEQVLRDRLVELGGEVELARELETFREGEDGIVATVADTSRGVTEEVRASWLLGCDGAHSAVRHILGLNFSGKTYAEHLVLADAEVHCKWPADHVLVWLNDAGLWASVPFPEAPVRRLIASASPDSEGRLPEASVEYFQRLLVERVGDTGTRIDNPRTLANFTLHCRMVDQYRRGRAFLAGDAAHIHSIAGGQGLNTGIQDAYNLAWKLALVIRGKADLKLLETYEEERHSVARMVLDETDTNQRLTVSTSPVARFVFERIVIPLLRLPGLGRALADLAFGLPSSLEHNYSGLTLATDPPAAEDTPLAPNLRHRTRANQTGPGTGKRGPQMGPRAGERAPDATCRTVEGKPTTLFEQFRGTQFNLLVFAALSAVDDTPWLQTLAQQVKAVLGDDVRTHLIVPAERAPAGRRGSDQVLFDPRGEARRFYGVTASCLCLIRPDGYIAFRSQPPDGESLQSYLRTRLAIVS